MSLQYRDDSKPLPKPPPHRRPLSSSVLISPVTSRNSSMNNSVGGEDYHNAARLEAGGTFSPGAAKPLNLALPEPATLRSKPSPQSDPVKTEQSPPLGQTRTHQRSLSNFLPFGARSRGDSISPERRSPTREKTQQELEQDFMPTLTGDKDGVVRIGEKQKGGLSSWFSGTSAPISLGLGIPVAEHEGLDVSQEGDSSNQRNNQNLNSSRNNSITPTATAPSRFNFFSSAKPAPQTIPLTKESIETDELLTLDITSALFPNPSSAQGPFSPAAFKNLQMNAEGILRKFQTAYRLRTQAYQEASADLEAQDDELDEADTRAQSLKSQLEDMSKRMAEQDRIMEDLVEQLATEKQARAEEKLARTTKPPAAAAPLSDTEDLGFSSSSPRPRSPHKTWRRSDASTSTASCDSDADIGSPTDSVFSRCRSPALTLASTITPDIPPAAGAQRIRKLLSGMAAAGPAECENCRGADVSVAWDAVGLLRAENTGLKERVGSLESAVEMALDLCSRGF